MKAIVNGKLVFPDRVREGVLLIENGKILAAGDIAVPEGAEVIDAEGLYVGPGFIDQHSHGYQQYGEGILAKDDPGACADAHVKHGTTTYIPSTDYADTLEEHFEMVKRCLALTEDDASPVRGIHLEGPYIDPLYGAASDMTMPYREEECEALFQMAAPVARHCTYAPEMPDAPAIEEKLSRYGITPAIGHTCAGPSDIERAVSRGAKIVTHLYDATGCFRSFDEAAKMTQHPQDLTSDVLLAIPGLYYELICDSHEAHATRYSIMRALRTAGEDHIILISDATVHDAVDGADDINFNDRGQLSGSRLTVGMAVRNFRRYTGADIRVLFKCASTNAAKAMGLFDSVGSVEAGKRADLVFVDEEMFVKKVFFGGEEVPEVRN